MLVSVRLFSAAPRASRVGAQRAPGVTATRQVAYPRTRAYCSAPEKAEEEVSPKVTEILEKLKQLTFVEIMSLGITGDRLLANAGFSAGAAPAATEAAAAAPEAPAAAETGSKDITCADIKLVGFPEGNKFHVLKEIRKLKPGMNLMDLVENLPQILQNRVSGDELEEWKKALDAVGAQYELVP